MNGNSVLGSEKTKNAFGRMHHFRQRASIQFSYLSRLIEFEQLKLTWMFKLQDLKLHANERFSWGCSTDTVMNFNDNAGLSCTLKHFSSPKSLSKNALESVTNASWTRVPQLCLNLFSVMRNAVLCNGELKKALRKL